MLIELGGSMYPVPRHAIEMPKPGVLMNRETKENAKSIRAAIAKSSEERPIMAALHRDWNLLSRYFSRWLT